MVEPRPAVTTVGFVDDECNDYQDLFGDVRTQRTPWQVEQI
ncbi:hypothetical protein [Chroococcidiopsis thermalis]|nr:hypothetical protein [Chroococcidiopsis thermalis]